MTDKVLDFVGKRKENIEVKRRSFERILFQNFLGAYTVIDNAGTAYPVELVDISHDGCLFQVPWNVKSDEKFGQGTEITMKMHFTKQSFIPVIVNVKYGNEFIGKDGQTYMHYGCEFDKSMPSFKAMESFINFMYDFAEHSTFERNPQKTFFL